MIWGRRVEEGSFKDRSSNISRDPELRGVCKDSGEEKKSVKRGQRGLERVIRDEVH